MAPKVSMVERCAKLNEEHGAAMFCEKGGKIRCMPCGADFDAIDGDKDLQTALGSYFTNDWSSTQTGALHNVLRWPFTSSTSGSDTPQPETSR